MNIRDMTLQNTINGVFFCLFIGIFWASMPLFGWSKYKLEGVNISCAVEWKPQSITSLSYIIMIFLDKNIIKKRFQCDSRKAENKCTV